MYNTIQIRVTTAKVFNSIEMKWNLFGIHVNTNFDLHKHVKIPGYPIRLCSTYLVLSLQDITMVAFSARGLGLESW